MPLPHANPPVSHRTSLLDTRSLSPENIISLFREAERLEQLQKRFGTFFDPREKRAPAKVVCCLFFEASTRTRMSFQTAAYRLGHQVLTMELNSSSSLSKGESELDTVLNICAMNPDVLVIRYGVSRELDEALPKLSMPIISAGYGTYAHPTQSLLDAFTLLRHHKGASYESMLSGVRVLIVGDIASSRVARSNFDVLSKLGAEIGICGPEELLPSADELPKGTKVFHDLDEALSWPTVYMGLRIQLERHAKAIDTSSYHARFGLTETRLKRLSKDTLLMHPGPINHGVEFSPEVMTDPRSRILDQVSNGVLIRAALLERSLGANA